MKGQRREGRRGGGPHPLLPGPGTFVHERRSGGGSGGRRGVDPTPGCLMVGPLSMRGGVEGGVEEEGEWIPLLIT